MATLSASSALSEGRELSVRSRDNACVVCGYTAETDVAHIAARNSASDHELFFLRDTIGGSLRDFKKDDYLNLLLLCPNHHRGFNNKKFVLLPSRDVRQQMISHEQADFNSRQSALDSHQQDPGRTVLTHPDLPYEFEYIPTSRDHSTFFRCAGPHDPTIQATIVDHYETHVIPLYHFPVSHYALLAESFRGMAAYHVQSARCQQARDDVALLRELYERRPNPPDQENVPIPALLTTRDPCLQARLESQPHPFPSGLQSIPAANEGGPSDVQEDSDGPGESLPSHDTRRDLLEHEDDDISGDGSAEYASAQLDNYQTEPAVTVEAIKTRPNFQVGQGVDLGRFMTSADHCRSPDAKPLP